jgi:hypothetical protein
VKKKDGRPPRSLAAWRALQAQAELEVRFPAVTVLIDTIAGNADPDHVKLALANAIDSVKAARGRSRETLATSASATDRQLHAAAEVERFVQDRHTLEQLAAVVTAELKIATADLAGAESRLRHAMLQSDPVDGYEHTLVKKLRAAGVTDRLAREINADHIVRIKDALDGALSVSAPKPRSARQKAEVVLAWAADNPWTSVMAKTENYRFDQRPMTPGAVDVAAMRQCGLPPHTDMAAFGDPHLVGQFEAASDARAKARTCWDVCKKWIADNIVEDIHSQGVALMRQRAWTFLFGIHHGFAHEIAKFDRVTFPSPSTPDEYVVAHRRS